MDRGPLPITGQAGEDPETALAALTPRLRALDDAPAPDPSFVARLEEDLMSRVGHAPTAGFPFGTNGRPQPVEIPRSGRDRRVGFRWPVTELAVVAVVLLTIATGFGAYRLAPTDPGGGWGQPAAFQDATPDASAGRAATGAGECEVSPRAEPIPAAMEGSDEPAGLPGTPTLALVTEAEATPSSSDGSGPPELSEDRLPVGTPAGAEAVDAIDATLDQLMACGDRDAGSDALFALYSDDYFRRPSTTAGGGITYWSPPPQLAGSGQALSVRDARVLSDGRVGAIVEGPFVPVFFVFVEDDPYWLIDEWVLLFDDVSMGGTPGPNAVGVGVSASCGATPEEDTSSSIAIEGRTVSAAIVASADREFRPDELEMAGNLDLRLTLLNCGDEATGFVIDELGVDQIVQAGETLSIRFQAPPGTYEYYSDLPGQREAGLVGTLTVLDQGTPTP